MYGENQTSISTVQGSDRQCCPPFEQMRPVFFFAQLCVFFGKSFLVNDHSFYFFRLLHVILSYLKVHSFSTFHLLTCWLTVSPSFLLVKVGRGCTPGTASVWINQTAFYHCTVEHKRKSAAFSTVSLATSWNLKCKNTYC